MGIDPGRDPSDIERQYFSAADHLFQLERALASVSGDLKRSAAKASLAIQVNKRRERVKALARKLF